MNWFFISFFATFLWSLVNISDQYLVSKYSTSDRGPGGLIIFSSIIGLFLALLILFFVKSVFYIQVSDIFLLLLIGFLNVLWVIFYLYSLEIEDVSKVVPWFLTVPIFGFIFEFIFFKETLTSYQTIGSIIILFGVGLMSFDFDKGFNRHGFNKKLAVYMVTTCITIALMGVLFKYVTLEESFLVSSFWQYIGLGITGILIYLFIPKYRNEFNEMNKEGGRNIFMLNISSETLTIIGNLLTNYTILLAPVTVVYLIGSFQPAIVLILTLIGTKFFPNIIKEDISKRVLLPKIIGVLILILGSIFVFS